MFTQTDTKTFVITQDAQDIIALLRKCHYYPRIITDFTGPITRPIINSSGNMVYMEFKEEDSAIIPKAVFRMHNEIRRAGHRDLQVIIGHEIKVVPEKPLAPSTPRPEIDWGNVGEVAAKGLLVVTLGIVMVPMFALAGLVALLDPSYCIVLDDGTGTVVELMAWNSEA